MRKSFALLAAGAVCLLGAGSAVAGPLSAASFRFVLGTLPAVAFAGAGTTGAATGSTLATIDGGTSFAGVLTTPVTDPAAAPITAVQAILTGNGPGTFTGTGGDLSGSASFTGLVNVQGGGGLTLLGVPVNVGSGATTAGSSYGVNITAISGTWTTGQAVVSGVPGLTTATRTGSNGLAGGAGPVLLVAPVTILTNLSGGTPIAAFAELALTYVPEPGTLLLLGSGVAGLAGLGRRRAG